VHEGPCGRHSQASCLKERCAASRLEGRSEATNAFVAVLEHSLRQAQGRLSRPPGGASERGLGNSKARKKWLGSALKSLKQLVRVMASSDRQISRQRSAPISAISRMTPRSRSMSSRCFFRPARPSLSPQASCSRSPLIGRRRSTFRRTRIRSPTPRRL